MSEHAVTLSLGSNLGNRLGMLRSALAKLEEGGVTITAASRVCETKPWGVTEQPLFLNICAKALTRLAAEDLLFLLKKTEAELGRSAGERWGPREIDIDIIFFDSLRFESEEMAIPHPRMHERGFVLAPLAEIAPDDVHPVLKKSVKELYDALPDSEKEGMTWITKR